MLDRIIIQLLLSCNISSCTSIVLMITTAAADSHKLKKQTIQEFNLTDGINSCSHIGYKSLQIPSTFLVSV